MSESAQHGPQIKDPAYKQFFDISTDAFVLFRNKTSNLGINNLPWHFWSRIAYFAESTSWSMRLLTSWDAALPAAALARIRIEQVIVCSYLIHEATKLGFEPFIRHLGPERYRNSKLAHENPILKPHLDEIMERDRPRILEKREELLGVFSFESFSRKWTKLDLLSMAKKRDTLTKSFQNISRHPLELDYVSIYGSFSSLVHSGIEAFSSDFVKAEIKDSNITLAPAAGSSRLLIMLLANWDVLQTFELLTKLGVDCEKESKTIFDRWLVYRDEVLK